MTNEDTPTVSALPEGDDDPNLTYIAVGRAIHAWEGLETALARLYLKMKKLPETPDHLADYGSQNRKFVDRVTAVNSAAYAYFVQRPNQEKEGEFCRLIEEVNELAIDRHRIAHGNITMVSELVPSGPIVKGQPFTLSGKFKYRWNPAFYSTGNLRTGVFGIGSKGLNIHHDKFQAKHREILSFTESLSP